MRNKQPLKPIAAAMGAALVASLASLPAAQAGENPFAVSKLTSGYMVADADKAKEGKCGEGKCGADKSSAAKDPEGRCGAKTKEGKCGEGKCGATNANTKAKEGKCGEGKCGAKK